MRSILKSVLWVSLLGAASAAHANLLVNGSFENASPGLGQPGSGGRSLQPGASSASYVAGWTAIAPFGVDNPNPNANIAWLGSTSLTDYGLQAEAGNDFIDLTGYTDSSPYAGIQQTVTGLSAGGQYALTFYVGTGFGSGRDAYAGPASVSVLATSPVPVIFVSQSFSAPASAAWTLETYDFTAAASTVTISIYGQFSGGGQYIGLDNADLEAASVVVVTPPAGTVPEPAGLSLFGLGATALALGRRRRSRIFAK
jgi:hypothetical protein